MPKAVELASKLDTVEPMPSSAGQAFSDDLAIKIAELGLVREPSEVTPLRQVNELAARAVAGCAGATSVLWRRDGGDPEPMVATGSHPALAELADLEISWGYGPIFDVVQARAPLTCTDTLRENRWPGYARALLRRGVRCFSTTLHENEHVLVTLTLYGVRAGALDPRQAAIASLLAAQGGAAISNTGQYENANRTAAQLQAAVQARGVVDQAKGVIMHAMKCDAEQAYAEMLRLSQSRNVKLTVLAERIVAGHGF